MTPKLTADDVRELLTYNPTTGELRWRVPAGRAAAGDVAGALRLDRYYAVQLNKKLYKAHRLAWLLMTGEWPRHTIDHIDGNRGNNRWKNLREATLRQQSHNRSGVLGISRNGNRWRAKIVSGGKRHHLGCYATPEAAREAYLLAKRRLHEFNTL